MNRMLKEKAAAHICSGNNGMTEGFKEFLTYGTEQKITKKQVMETYIILLLLGVCGISVGRMLTNGLTYETLMKIGGVCFYFLAIVFLLGILNLIKYFYCRKYLGGI